MPEAISTEGEAGDAHWIDIGRAFVCFNHWSDSGGHVCILGAIGQIASKEASIVPNHSGDLLCTSGGESRHLHRRQPATLRLSF